MAHFFPPDGRRDGYDVDGKLAPDSASGMRILTKQRRVVGLWGGEALAVTSTNTNVVPNDGFGETRSAAGVRMLSLLGKTPGTATLETRLGANLWCSLKISVADVDLSANPIKDDRSFDLYVPPEWDLSGTFEPLSGSIPCAAGFGVNAVTRIPVPGTNLVVELSAHGYKGSTSTIFIWEQNAGKNGKHLRLDYGYNTKTKTVDYHWNRKGSAKQFFGIQDHATVGKGGEILFKAGKYLKWGGRVLLVVGIAIDVISIATSSKPLKRASEAVAGWAGAWAGCKVLGPAGAALGSAAPGAGTAIGAFTGCIIGGAIGYYAFSKAAGVVYDWGEGTIFTPLPATSAP